MEQFTLGNQSSIPIRTTSTSNSGKKITETLQMLNRFHSEEIWPISFLCISWWKGICSIVDEERTSAVYIWRRKHVFAVSQFPQNIFIPTPAAPTVSITMFTSPSISQSVYQSHIQKHLWGRKNWLEGQTNLFEGVNKLVGGNHFGRGVKKLGSTRGYHIFIVWAFASLFWRNTRMRIEYE